MIFFGFFRINFLIEGKTKEPTLENVKSLITNRINTLKCARRTIEDSHFTSEVYTFESEREQREFNEIVKEIASCIACVEILDSLISMWKRLECYSYCPPVRPRFDIFLSEKGGYVSVKIVEIEYQDYKYHI